MFWIWLLIVVVPFVKTQQACASFSDMALCSGALSASGCKCIWKTFTLIGNTESNRQTQQQTTIIDSTLSSLLSSSSSSSTLSPTPMQTELPTPQPSPIPTPLPTPTANPTPFPTPLPSPAPTPFPTCSYSGCSNGRQIPCDTQMNCTTITSSGGPCTCPCKTSYYNTCYDHSSSGGSRFKCGWVDDSYCKNVAALSLNPFNCSLALDATSCKQRICFQSVSGPDYYDYCLWNAARSTCECPRLVRCGTVAGLCDKRQTCTGANDVCQAGGSKTNPTCRCVTITAAPTPTPFPTDAPTPDTTIVRRRRRDVEDDNTGVCVCSEEFNNVNTGMSVDTVSGMNNSNNNNEGDGVSSWAIPLSVALVLVVVGLVVIILVITIRRKKNESASSAAAAADKPALSTVGQSSIYSATQFNKDSRIDSTPTIGNNNNNNNNNNHYQSVPRSHGTETSDDSTGNYSAFALDNRATPPVLRQQSSYGMLDLKQHQDHYTQMEFK